MAPDLIEYCYMFDPCAARDRWLCADVTIAMIDAVDMWLRPSRSLSCLVAAIMSNGGDPYSLYIYRFAAIGVINDGVSR